MNDEFPPGRHSNNLQFNPNFEAEERLCGYEHCIETMPFTDRDLDCPVFGHDCPGGRTQVDACRRTKGRPHPLSLVKGTKPVVQISLPIPPGSAEPAAVEESPSLEEILRDQLPKLKLVQTHLELLRGLRIGSVSSWQDSLRGCERILSEFLALIEKHLRRPLRAQRALETDEAEPHHCPKDSKGHEVLSPPIGP